MWGAYGARPSGPLKDSLKPNAAKRTSAFQTVRCCSRLAKFAGLGWRFTSSADHEKLRKVEPGNSFHVHLESRPSTESNNIQILIEIPGM